MNVLDHRPQCSRVGDVAVIAAATLPEAIMDLTVGLAIAQMLEKMGCLLANKSQRLPLNGNFERCPNEAHFINGIPRPDDDMNMLGHNDIGPQEKVAFP